jgi:hypothetical protein
VALERNQLGDAESRARDAADAFRAQKNSDFETDALASLTRALVGENKLTDARAAIDRANKLPAQDIGIRLKLAIADVYLEAREGKATDALRALAATIQKAVDLKLKRFELEARLAKAELELEANSSPANKLQAKRLQADANGSGFALIARKAATLAK